MQGEPGLIKQALREKITVLQEEKASDRVYSGMALIIAYLLQTDTIWNSDWVMS